MDASRGRLAAGERKSLTLDERRKERRVSSDRRKSGPKAVDVASTVLDGKAGRRRLSASHRRTSKSNKAAALRRERGQPRPPLVGHRGIGRASLPARLSQAAAAEIAAAVAVGATASAGDDGAVAMEQEDMVEKSEEGGDGREGEGSWTPERVAEAAKAILCDDKQLQIRSLRWLRVVLSLSENPPAKEVVEAGLLPRLVDFLRQSDCQELRPEALCALTNIASTKFTKAVASEPLTLPTLMALLASPDLNLREQSAWCVGNIAADGVEMRDLVLNAGVLEPLLASLSPPQQGSTRTPTPTSFMRTGTWALNNLCRRLPPPPLSVVLPIIDTLRPLLEAANTTDAEILIDAGWALYHITRAGSDRIDAVLSAGMLSMMPDMILHDNAQVVRPAIRAMDNLACSSAAYRGALIEAGVLDPLVETLGNDSPKVRADALRLLSCMAAGSPDQVTAVVSTPDVLPSVVTELEEGNALCRKEAAWVFLNMCECGHEPHATIVPGIVGNGGVSAVCRNLEVDSDAESLLVMLSLLFTILDEAAGGATSTELAEYVTLVEEADGFEKILALANDHDDMEIYDKAMDIISSFNPGDSDDDSDNTSEDAGGPVFESAAPHTPSHAPAGRDDDDDDKMSDDSLSDDSFHKELAGTSGHITPPQQHRPPPAARQTSPTPPASLPRTPLGAVHQYPVAGGNGSGNDSVKGSGNCPGGEGSGEVGADHTAASGAPRAGIHGAAERKMAFRDSEGDKTE
eukprot:g5903.t1